MEPNLTPNTFAELLAVRKATERVGFWHPPFGLVESVCIGNKWYDNTVQARPWSLSLVLSLPESDGTSSCLVWTAQCLDVGLA